MNLYTKGMTGAAFTYADLKAEAERIFPDDYKPTRKAGLGSIGLYSVAELRKAHIDINITPAMRVERALAASAAWDRMAANALHGGPDYDAAKAEFAAEDERQGRVA